MSRASISKGRLNFVLIVIIMLFVAIIGRLLYLHIWNQAKLVNVVERNRQKFEVINARRGNIVDRRGNLLASTNMTVDLGVDPQMQQDTDREKWPELARLLHIDLIDVEKAFTEKFRKIKNKEGIEEVSKIRWTKLMASLDDDTYEKVMGLKIKGIYGNRKYERVYPHGSLAAHVLGFVNKEGVAVAGVEHFLNFYLSGQDGWLETECDAHRKELGQFRNREVKAVNGNNVELTIDLMVQHAIEEELERIVRETNPKSACIIVSEPATGYILGLANYPTFDPNEFWKYDIDSHRNRAVSDVMEPGSAFKMITASAIINESVTTLDEKFDCSIDRVEYKGRIVRLPKDHRPMDVLSFRDVIKKSSNRGIAQLAMRLGDERLYEYTRAFGFGEKTGYGPGLEVRGTVHEVKNWDGLTISRMPMGHAIDSTVLQLHGAMSVFANHGILMQPQIIKKVFDENGHEVINFAPKARRRVISEETSSTMVNLLSEVVGPDGTSFRASIGGYTVAGKSGTSQKIINGKYSTKYHIATFSGFIPADNPRVMITVVIDEAKINRVAFGGVVAAPAFRNIGEQLIQYLNIQPNNLTQKLIAWN